MKTKILALVFAGVLISGPVFANNVHVNDHSVTNTNDQTNLNLDVNRQNQGQSLSNRNRLSNSAVGSGNSTSVGGQSTTVGGASLTSLTKSNYEAPAIAPDLAALMPTADCQKPVTAAFNPLNLFAFGFGFTHDSDTCNKLNFAKALTALGKPDAAIAVLCKIDDIASGMAAAHEPCPAPVADSRATQAVTSQTAFHPTPAKSSCVTYEDGKRIACKDFR